MGYQLWVSPITGYRRRGTRLAELRSVFGKGITALTILEPIQCCPANACAIEMADQLRSRDFDVAGVKETPNGPLLGFVYRDSLQNGLVREHLQRFETEHLVSEGISLDNLLSVLMRTPRVFVLVGSRVTGIISRADLNKPPVRVYLFGLISLLEMHLGFWIKEHFSDDVWKEQLSTNRVRCAEKLMDQRRLKNHQISLFDCLQFCDKRDLVVKSEEICRRLAIGSKNQTRSFLKRAEDLRNQLAHSQYDIGRIGWDKLIELVGWIEGVVHRSDELVESKVAEIISDFRSELWS